MFWIGIFIGFNLGVISLAIFMASKRVTDDECSNCSRAYKEQIAELEAKLKGMRSSNGKLGKEIQHLAFMKDGYKHR